jgi:hypothetical protein
MLGFFGVQNPMILQKLSRTRVLKKKRKKRKARNKQTRTDATDQSLSGVLEHFPAHTAGAALVAHTLAARLVIHARSIFSWNGSLRVEVKTKRAPKNF